MSSNTIYTETVTGNNTYQNNLQIPVDGYRASATTLSSGLITAINNDTYLKTNKVGTEGGSFVCTDNLTIQRASSLINLKSGSRDSVNIESNNDVYISKKNAASGIHFNADDQSFGPYNNGYYKNRTAVIGYGQTVGYNIGAIPETIIIASDLITLPSALIKIKNYNDGSGDYDFSLLNGKIFEVSISDITTDPNYVDIYLYNNATDYNTGNLNGGYSQRVRIQFGTDGIHSVRYVYLKTGIYNGVIKPISFTTKNNVNISDARYAKLYSF